MSWNPLNWFYGVDDAIERGKLLDERMNALNQRNVARGAMTEESYQQYLANNEFASTQYTADVTNAFWEGAEEGFDRITAPIQSAASAAAEAGKKALSFWLVMQWVALLVVVWLGYKYFTGGGSIRALTVGGGK